MKSHDANIQKCICFACFTVPFQNFTLDAFSVNTTPFFCHFPFFFKSKYKIFYIFIRFHLPNQKHAFLLWLWKSVLASAWITCITLLLKFNLSLRSAHKQTGFWDVATSLEASCNPICNLRKCDVESWNHRYTYTDNGRLSERYLVTTKLQFVNWFN